jgi:hypothetical protein
VPSPLEIVHVLFLERKILVSLIADHSTRRKLDLRVKSIKMATAVMDHADP